MKRYFATIPSLILILILGLSACTTNDSVLSSEKESPLFDNKIAVVDDHLTIADKSFYEQLVEDQEENLKEQLIDRLDHEESFVSMKKFFEDPAVRARYISRSGRYYAEDNPIEDEFLASILNPDGIVQIGEWIIKVNLE